MFTKSDLSTLLDDAPPLGVSLFMPTHVRGSEIRQGPIMLKTLLGEARDKLLAVLPVGKADAMLAAARALIDDYAFWQHQDHGLALFLSGPQTRQYRVPLPLDAKVAVGPGWHLRPLLPVLAADGVFQVLTITADAVRLFDASRFAMTEAPSADLPSSLAEVAGESDYENPLQASPANRPQTTSTSVTKAQVYGDSPAEWRRGNLIGFVRQVAAAVDARLATSTHPVVVSAAADVQGHFRTFSKLGSRLAGVVETNPEAVGVEAVHAAAYAIVQPGFAEATRRAIERFVALRGSADARACDALAAVVGAAHHGRVDSLLLDTAATAWGRYDPVSDRIERAERFAATGEDLLETAAVQTLRQGGAVHVLSSEDMPSEEAVAAVLRY